MYTEAQKKTLEMISKIGIIPVIAIDDAAKAVPLARALVAGGLPAAEVTFRTAAAEDAIKAIAAEVPEMLLGAGTVFGLNVMPAAYEPMTIMLQVPGGFVTLGLLLIVVNALRNAVQKKSVKKEAA